MKFTTECTGTYLRIFSCHCSTTWCSVKTMMTSSSNMHKKSSSSVNVTCSGIPQEGVCIPLTFLIYPENSDDLCWFISSILLSICTSDRLKQPSELLLSTSRKRLYFYRKKFNKVTCVLHLLFSNWRWYTAKTIFWCYPLNASKSSSGETTSGKEGNHVVCNNKFPPPCY